MPLRNPVLRQLRRRRIPTWWQDAKLGIFVHWTPASVPAFAPVDMEISGLLQSGRRDALAWSPYSEWYENSLRFPDSPVASPPPIGVRRSPVRRIRGRLGGRARRSGIPTTWAARFAATGARYVVLVTKHHDGYCLWPTDVPQPASVRLGVSPRRRRRARRSRARGRSALRPLLLGRSRLDLRRPADRLAGRHARRDSSRRLSRPTPMPRSAS